MGKLIKLIKHNWKRTVLLNLKTYSQTGSSIINHIRVNTSILFKYNIA